MLSDQAWSLSISRSDLCVKCMFFGTTFYFHEGLTFETSASESLYCGQFTLSTQLIKPNYLVQLPPTPRHCFFRNLPPLFLISDIGTLKTIPFEGYFCTVGTQSVPNSNTSILRFSHLILTAARSQTASPLGVCYVITEQFQSTLRQGINASPRSSLVSGVTRLGPTCPLCPISSD